MARRVGGLAETAWPAPAGRLGGVSAPFADRHSPKACRPGASSGAGGAFGHGAGHHGLLRDHAGFAGGALHAVDQGAPARRAALGQPALDGLVLAREATIVDGLAVDKLPHLDAAVPADLAAQRGEDAGDLGLAEVLVVTQQLDDTKAVAGRGSVTAIDAEAEVGVGADVAVEHFGEAGELFGIEPGEMHAHGMGRGEAEHAVNPPQQRHQAPGAQQDVEAQGKGADEGDEHGELVGAGIHAAQADGTKTELDEGEHQHGVLHPEAGPQEEVVQVVAVGVEGRAAHPDAAQHDAQGVDERDGKQPQGGDGGDGAGGDVAHLGEIGEQPGKDEAELHAAVVAQEAAGAAAVEVTQVVVEEAGNPAGDHDDEREVGHVARHEHGEGDEQQADDGDGTRQAVDAVDHVEGVDGAHGGDEGERDADEAEGEHFGVGGEVAEIVEGDAAPIHHGEADGGLDDQADLEADVEDVVGEAGDPHGEDADHKGVEARIGEVVEVIDQRCAAQGCRQHANAADEGRDGVVGLVATGFVDHAKAMGRDDGVAHSHRRDDKPQQEKRKREHLP